jgi:hypothetical protein
VDINLGNAHMHEECSFPSHFEPPECNSTYFQGLHHLYLMMSQYSPPDI